MNGRLVLNNGINPEIFRQYYYLKEELVEFCRKMGLPVSGSKQELTERIVVFLTTGEKKEPVRKRKVNRNTCDCLTPDSLIETDFVCSEKHRAFFRQMIGPAFTFKVPFQKWLKEHAGSTYAEAVEMWFRLQHHREKIGSQFEYNTYVRDFFRDNPGRTLKEAICCWKYKKGLPGSHVYECGDLQVLSECCPNELRANRKI